MDTEAALAMAQEQDLDLVEVASQADPPVCRIMDYGKYKYEQAVKQKEARKKQSLVVVKEMKMRPKIDRHDYETKKGHVVRFLRQGAKVKVTIMFRGREMAHTDLGRKLLDQLAQDVAEIAKVDIAPKVDGRNMTMVLAPYKEAVTVRPAPAPKHASPLPEPEAEAETVTETETETETEAEEEAAVSAEAEEPETSTEEEPEADAPKRPVKVTRAEGG
jgi:translation initiation factor IF-3